jgi:hypothetical protein
MKSKLLILLILSSCGLSAQEIPKRFLPGTSASLQFAGSTGFLTAGVFKGTANEKIQLGLLYGHTPKEFGGPLHSLSLKFLYDPFKINLTKKIFFDPIQVGVFACQNFGSSLETKWDDKYPKGYYWWSPSLRGHVFLSTSLGIRSPDSKWLDHVSCYFEANTNDLYFASYVIKNNNHSLTLYDIVFFGTGLRFHFKPIKE